MKQIVVLGGPNGAGKTTAAQFILPRKFGLSDFLNADEIARGLSPFNPDAAAMAAGRLMLARMRELANGQHSFAFETTCSGKGHVPFLRGCKARGWQVALVFLWLPAPQLAVARVARRAASGGHGIPPETVVRRYWAGLRNMLTDYLPLAEYAAIYDNDHEQPLMVAEHLPGAALHVHDPERWEQIERARHVRYDPAAHE